MLPVCIFTELYLISSVLRLFQGEVQFEELKLCLFYSLHKTSLFASSLFFRKVCRSPVLAPLSVTQLRRVSLQSFLQARACARTAGSLILVCDIDVQFSVDLTRTASCLTFVTKAHFYQRLKISPKVISSKQWKEKQKGKGKSSGPIIEIIRFLSKTWVQLLVDLLLQQKEKKKRYAV